MLISAGWASLAALFSFSIAMVIWGRHGDNSIKF
ncbi:MAG: cytochrome b6-f complex subunit PetN [Cyanobacteria bacterium]|nr:MULTISPECIES: cytochrome b6-f complex subunit PetN [unclassified Cyanobium]MCP9904382.1 cytochrome b6-f complex subunit PetN [Cyanobium sp. BA5m-10]MCP9907157.1 cytochrome b6-f complex subunit PetN [Cyanobium sp. BA5m-21]MDA0717386.1 cytochrome b6-f complex subunit PetN [Cyanobacteriota bacterium]MDA1246067.1 cytochrome b6-f complex subunit PetN [Cyanobacteriota bacterium]